MQMNADGIEPATLKPRDHKTTALTIVLSPLCVFLSTEVGIWSLEVLQ